MAMMLPMRVDVNAVPEQNFSRRIFILVGHISELRFSKDEFTPAELEVIKNTPFLHSSTQRFVVRLIFKPNRVKT